MKNIKEALEKYASKANDKYALDAWTEDYTNGFNHAVKLLFPLIELMKDSLNLERLTKEESIEYYHQYKVRVRQTLKELETE